MGFGGLFDPPSRNQSKRSSKQKGPVAPPAPPVQSPQSYLDVLIRSRGYSTIRFRTLHSAYYCKPTPLQQASHDVYLIKILKDNDVAAFQEIMESGVSPNPCNSFGESILHMVARRGDFELFEVMINAGASVQVADDCGRTPLHDSCWSKDPCFPIVEMILERDPRLFHMADVRGAVPLSYVRKENWAAWIQWLDDKKDVYWPVRDIARQGEQDAPPLTELPAHSRPVPDPKNALSCELAQMVASGRMRPQEAIFLNCDSNEMTGDDSDSDSYSDSDFDSDDDDDDSEYDDDLSCSSTSSSGLDEEEMAGIISSLAR